ncbi:uncharacterized protein PGTG_05101 [Puccinia graminis f. sp. tritici CRL 75-36-700-3]|uniref:Uncharacterized protein n=1 Tax=Puccinia graminis f. sp. tritici (strain CRL 75-36-700-3 / race SCCL) TaxID=418459 RepID=E3K6E5_PUCGT|nr:uncharacterized protein PGTG_05101 [Puccinia graminis f. sp. tritici CRL 75-36-700-3]EFP79876.2 hypothetical protein PGTG_05101 [Puccinia graminis f. sp. tritici CRL 75-36-700-3]
MFVSPSNSIVFFTFISTYVLGRAVPQSGSSFQESHDLRRIIADYSAEVTAQEEMIKGVWNQLNAPDTQSEENVSTLCSELIESYYRQMEPRNRMIELVPTDNVLDANSLEYLVAVASRYANNVMHLARQIRQDPLDQESSASALNFLAKEHQKAHMFDQVLLGLADVAQGPEASRNVEEISTESNNQSIFEDNEVASTEGFSLAQVEALENSNASGISVTIEEEKTTTTETVVTSYKETLTY